VDVSPLESIVEDLRLLVPARLEAAADFVHRRKGISEEERQAVLARTAGALSPEEVGELERVIGEGCEKIDEDGWQRPGGQELRGCALPRRPGLASAVCSAPVGRG
jgi:hypothetical protein